MQQQQDAVRSVFFLVPHEGFDMRWRVIDPEIRKLHGLYYNSMLSLSPESDVHAGRSHFIQHFLHQTMSGMDLL